MLLLDRPRSADEEILNPRIQCVQAVRLSAKLLGRFRDDLGASVAGLNGRPLWGLVRGSPPLTCPVLENPRRLFDLPEAQSRGVVYVRRSLSGPPEFPRTAPEPPSGPRRFPPR